MYLSIFIYPPNSLPFYLHTQSLSSSFFIFFEVHQKFIEAIARFFVVVIHLLFIKFSCLWYVIFFIGFFYYFFYVIFFYSHFSISHIIINLFSFDHIYVIVDLSFIVNSFYRRFMFFFNIYYYLLNLLNLCTGCLLLQSRKS